MSIFIRKSLLAGILIGLAGALFLSVEQPYVAAFIFSIGLISVILLGCNLYTGKVGYARTPGDVPGLLGMCLLNIIGAGLIGLVTHPIASPAAEAVAAKKLSKPLPQAVISACLCGMLIYLAVELYKRSQNLLTIIIPVFTFVTAGTDHCIANAYYFAAAMTFNLQVFLFLVVCILGNATGSLVISLLAVKEAG